MKYLIRMCLFICKVTPQ